MSSLNVSPAGIATSTGVASAGNAKAAPEAAASGAIAAAHASPAVQAPQPLQIDPVAMKQQLQNIAEMLHQQVQRSQSNLGFSVDKAANVFVITVRNLETNEVIRQIPGEDVLKVAHSIESLKGILYNKII